VSQGYLEAFMLMAIEKETLVSLDTDCIVERVSEKSALMQRLLI